VRTPTVSAAEFPAYRKITADLSWGLAAGPRAGNGLGLFILAYLLAADAPAGLAAPGRWLRRQAPLLAAGLITADAALAAYAIHPPTSAWLALTGLAAAITAYLGALPSWRDRLRPPPAAPG
jgi:hypothetical protein